MFTDVMQFLVAVVRHWQGYVTAGAVMALLAVYDATGGTLVRWYYLLIFLPVFFPLSCFLAWQDQARLARQLDDRRAQQGNADEYAPLLQAGRKIAVQWIGLVTELNSLDRRPFKRGPGPSDSGRPRSRRRCPARDERASRTPGCQHAGQSWRTSRPSGIGPLASAHETRCAWTKRPATQGRGA